MGPQTLERHVPSRWSLLLRPEAARMREWVGGVVPSASPSGGHMFYKVSSLIVLATASIALTFGVAGCSKTNTPDTSAQSQPAQTDQSQDAAATDNLAPTDGTQAADVNAQQQPVSQAPQPYYQQPARVRHTSSHRAVQQVPQDQYYSNNDYSADYQDASYGQPVLQAQQPPPPLPEYSQPPIPGNGYLWTPGYWSYAPQGSFWGHRPCAGDKAVALRSIAPISGRPQIAIAGDWRLRIFRQWWRRLLCLKHGLAVTRILVFGVVVVIGIVRVLRDLLHRST